MLRTCFVASCMLLAPLSVCAVGAEDIAVIVNHENGTENVSMRELMDIFRQERRHWEGGEKISLVLREAGSPERQTILSKVYQMRNDVDLKNFWIRKQYSGSLFSFPKILPSDEEIKVFVSAVPNAIGFINVDSLDASVKALRIDGKRPGEPGYFLKRDTDAKM